MVTVVSKVFRICSAVFFSALFQLFFLHKMFSFLRVTYRSLFCSLTNRNHFFAAAVYVFALFFPSETASFLSSNKFIFFCLKFFVLILFFSYFTTGQRNWELQFKKFFFSVWTFFTRKQILATNLTKVKRKLPTGRFRLCHSSLETQVWQQSPDHWSF